MSRERTEVIAWGGRTRCYIVKAGPPPSRTTFVTEPDAGMQVGQVVHPAGVAVAPHVHRPVSREVTGAPEVLLVQQGRCEMALYDTEGQLRERRELAAGDLVVLLECGHGFRMLEDTVLLEVKQGPYAGPHEKQLL